MVNVGLIQSACSPDPLRTGADAGCGGPRGQARRPDHLHARAVSLAILSASLRTTITSNGREPIPGPTTTAFERLAKQHEVVVIASLFEKRTSGLYHNTAAVIDADGSLLGVYRKMHIPDDPLYYEKFYFTPGDLGIPRLADSLRARSRRADLAGDPVGTSEAARLNRPARCGDTLLSPTAIGWHPREKPASASDRHSAWRLSNASHAIANGCYVATPNRGRA